MKAANITAAVAVTLWLALAMLGRSSITDFLVDDVPDWPTITNIDFQIIIPMSLAVGLLGWAWLCNAVLRRPWALAGPAIVCLTLTLPFVALTGGGM